jgi:saccharopine dehydrogenase-like NADP-dependent oxidoreductase
MFSQREFHVNRIAPLDALGELMFEKLAFRPGERDLLVLHHDFRVELPDGRREHTVAQMIGYGVPFGDSSMSRTVALPAAIGVDLILKDRIRTPGVLRPTTPEIYNPVLDELAALDIASREKTETF